jgi:hypothetical protein
MSGGLNRSFMLDPMAFMRTNPMDIKDLSELAGGIDLSGKPSIGSSLQIGPGVNDFDLERAEDGTIYVRLFESRTKKSVSSRSRRIKAYWLPWRASFEKPSKSKPLQGCSSIQLGDEADYFFTSALAGCRIQIGGGANPLVLHLSGDMSSKDRDVSARLNMSPEDYARSRRFSRTREYAGTETAFLVGKAYTEGSRQWRFFAQGVGFADQEHRRRTVVALVKHGNGVVVL